jgi:hypothetical protein
MKTTRTVAYKLLDPEDTGVTLKTLSKAAKATEWNLIDLLVAVDHKKPHHDKRKR